MKRILFILLAVLTMTSCGQKSYKDTKNRQYNQYYDEFGIKDLESEFYSKENEVYGIYMYGVACKYCEYCKGAVFDYLDDLKEKKDKNLDNLYIFDIGTDAKTKDYFKAKPKNFNFNISGDLYIQKMLGATSITETYFFGTPTLYVIKDHKLSGVYVDTEQVGNYLEKN